MSLIISSLIQQEPEFWTLTLGNVLTIIIFVVGLVHTQFNNKAEFNKMQFKIDLIWDWFEDNMIDPNSKKKPKA